MFSFDGLPPCSETDCQFVGSRTKSTSRVGNNDIIPVKLCSLYRAAIPGNPVFGANCARMARIRTFPEKPCDESPNHRKLPDTSDKGGCIYRFSSTCLITRAGHLKSTSPVTALLIRTLRFSAGYLASERRSCLNYLLCDSQLVVSGLIRGRFMGDPQ